MLIAYMEHSKQKKMKKCFKKRVNHGYETNQYLQVWQVVNSANNVSTPIMREVGK
jgi:hypothetical protein